MSILNAGGKRSRSGRTGCGARATSRILRFLVTSLVARAAGLCWNVEVRRLRRMFFKSEGFAINGNASAARSMAVDPTPYINLQEYVKMAAQIKKIVLGPLTRAEEEPALKGTDYEGTVPANERAGVIFVFPKRADEDKPRALRFDLENIGTETLTRLAVHGMSQKLGDSFAGAANEADPLKFAEESIDAVWKQLQSGEWRATGGAGGPKASMLAKALSRVMGRDLEECIEVVDGMTDEDKKKLRKDPRIKQASADIRLEEAQAARERAGKQAQEAGGDTGDLGSLFGA